MIKLQHKMSKLIHKIIELKKIVVVVFGGGSGDDGDAGGSNKCNQTEFILFRYEPKPVCLFVFTAILITLFCLQT